MSCNGSGKVTCPTCDGSGKSKIMEFGDGGKIFWEEITCTQCGGSKKVTCYTCSGRGKT